MNWKSLLTTLASLLLFCSVQAQGDTAQVEYSLRSPYKTVETHLKYLQDATYRPDIAAKTIPAKDKSESESLAIKLKQVLDAKGLFVDMDQIPENPNYMDSTVMRQRYQLFPKELPKVYVEKKGDKWYYSQETVAAIPKLHKQVFPFGSDLLVNLFPSFGQEKFLGLRVWQYIGILIFILALFVIHKLLTIAIEAIIRRLEHRYSTFTSSGNALRKIAKPLSLLIITIIVIPFEPILQLPIEVSRYLVLIINALTPLFATLAIYRAVDLLGQYLLVVADRTENKLDDQLVPLIKKALKVFVILIGGLYILQNLDFNITALLAGISIGGIALALAAQDTLKNFFGSIMIFLDKPFQIGDWINFNGVDGTVEEVGFRSTRVRTFANSLVYVPNGKLADMVIDNFGLRQYRRFYATIAVTYDTPPALLQKFVDGLNEIVANHPDTRKDFWEVKLNAMGDHSLNIMFYMFFDVPEWTQEVKGRHEILMSIIELADELGVRFAFPTSTIHVEDLPGQESLSPEYDTDQDTLNKKVAAFIEKYKGDKDKN